MEENEQIEENDGPTVKSISIKWGLIGGFIGIIFFVILDFAGMSFSSVRWVGLVIPFVLMYLAHREFKNEGDGYLSYGQGLGIGTLYSLVGSIVQSIFTYIYVSFVNTNYISQAREYTIMQWEEQGMSQDQIDQATPFMETMNSPMAMLIMGIIMGVFVGFIIALIVSIFTKNQAPEFS